MAIALAFIAGWRVSAWRYDAIHKTELERVIAEYEVKDAEKTQRATELENQLAEARQKEKIRYVTRQKIIERPVYRDCAIDTDGLQFITDRATETNTARKHAYGLPAGDEVK
jgi:hypothetical protein